MFVFTGAYRGSLVQGLVDEGTPSATPDTRKSETAESNSLHSMSKSSQHAEESERPTSKPRDDRMPIDRRKEQESSQAQRVPPKKTSPPKPVFNVVGELEKGRTIR